MTVITPPESAKLEPRSPVRRRFTQNNLVAAACLLIILLVGGYFRFVGQNWDDFTYLHPDERFLTINLLPHIGGGLELTPDQERYPDQVLLVRMGESRFRSRLELASGLYRIAVPAGTYSQSVARALAGDANVVSHDTVDATIQALTSGAVDAMMIDQSALVLISGLQQLESIGSADTQLIRCRDRYPDSGGIGGFFDAECSPLNPHNASQAFYTYGSLPLFIAHFGSEFVRLQDQAGSPLFDFQGGHLVWRFLSALFDMGTILLVFAVGTRMHNKWVGLVAALLYAAAPLAIQKSHYGTVNAITNFWVMLAILFAVQVQARGRWWAYAGFGVSYAAALAGRINLAPLAGLVVLAAGVYAAPVFDGRLPWPERRRLFFSALGGLVLAGLASIVAFRIFNPYTFMGPGFFGLTPNPRWFDNIAAGSYGVSGYQDSPPNWQWLARPSYIYAFKDMLFWGMGVMFTLAAVVGWVWSGWRLLLGRPGALRNLLLFAWVLVYFAWMGRLWVMTMRYYLPLYGALALLAGWLLVELVRRAHEQRDDLPLTRLLLAISGLFFALVGLLHGSFTAFDFTALASLVFGLGLLAGAFLPSLQGRRAVVLLAAVAGFSLLWGLMFSSIYRHQLTRVQAAHWLWENVSGDFSMQIDGAPPGTPLINIAMPNSGTIPQDALSSPLLNAATTYQEGQPLFASFIAPASGTVTSIHAPYLGDPLDDPEPEQLYISISFDMTGEPLATATLVADLSRDGHPLGRSYDIPLDTPLEVEAGTRYTVKVEALQGGGPIIGSGAVVTDEGAWDNAVSATRICNLPDGLTSADRPPSGLVSAQDCMGREAWHALINAFDMAMSFPVDNRQKLDNMLLGLDMADYITISSNRFYDSLMRNRIRWPMSSRFYEALFAGELGYELVAVFDETYEFGPLRVSDQHLLHYSSPLWLNDLESDEAFNVYDHPAVYILKKRDDYSPEQARLVLGSVPLAQVHELPLNINDVPENYGDPTLLGVINWPSIDADRAPTALNLPPGDLEAQRGGGTWSERFFSESPLNTSQPLGVVVWWLMITAFGLAAWPLLFVLLPGLADRGYGFARFVGLLLTAWLAWALASFHVPAWGQAGVLVCLLLVASLSGGMVWRQRGALRDYVRQHWQRLAVIELLALLAFAFFIFVRLTNPDLWHFSKGGEKPMDFAYFNAVLRSTSFPPYDPWFAGGYMNYYYFGFVLVGSPVLLLGYVPSFAYNLIIPTLFSLTGIGAFSVAFNIASKWQERRSTDTADTRPPRRVANPWIAGIAALLLCVFAGNLDTVRVIGNGMASLGGYDQPASLSQYLVLQHVRSTAQPPSAEEAVLLQQRAAQNHLPDRLAYEVENSFALWTSIFRGLGQMFTGAPLPIGSDRWYWGPSRVLAEVHYETARDYAITEMPYFTFLYGDLHAHMINLPVLLFVLAFLFNEFVLAGQERRGTWARLLALALGALAVGLIRAINTWDWPSFLLFALVGLCYFWWLRWGQIGRRSLLDFAVYVGGFAVMSFLFALPYSAWYSAVYNSIDLWRDVRSPLWAYFVIHGLFLFLIVSLLIWETARWLRSVRVAALRGRGNWVYAGLFVTLVVFLLALAASAGGYQVALVVVPLVLWIAVLFFRPGQTRAMRYLLVMSGFALAMTLGVEVIVISGDIGRQNTVFKFYMQVWILFSVVGGVAFAALLSSSEHWAGRLRFLWFIPLVTMFVIAGMYPFTATRARALDRMGPDTPLTLDGLDYMQYARHGDANPLTGETAWLELVDDYHIIRWLQENVQGTPVIMEGRRYGSEYQWNGRIAINTGLPAVLGWNFHQRQQRTFDPLPRFVDQRGENIIAFYNTPEIEIAVDILWHYEVQYVILSAMERLQSNPAGLAKFELMAEMGLLHVVHEQGEGLIYEVDRDALARYKLARIALAAEVEEQR